jgi:hypothetical protein
MRGKSQSASGAGVTLLGVDATNRADVRGGNIELDGRGTSTVGLNLSNATVGNATDTTRVALLSDGFANSSTGGVVIGSGVTITGKGSAALEIASSDVSRAAQIGGASNSGSGFWVSDSQLAGILGNQTGFDNVVLGGENVNAQTTVKGAALATIFSATPLAADVKVQGGHGGLTLDGSITNGLAADKVLTIATRNGGALNLGTGSVASANVKLSATGTGASIAQTGGGGVNASSLLLDAAGATVTLDGSANTVTTVAGAVAGGSISNAQTLTVGATQGSTGLTSNGTLAVKTTGATSDLQLDAALTSTSGDIVAAAGRHFINTVTGDQGLQAANGRYLVYSAQPASLPSSTNSARGMSGGFNKRYAQSFSGTTPAYASTGNWFFYANTPTVTVSPGNGTVVYGESGAGAFSVTGLIDGDTQAAALSGTPALTGGAFTATGSGNRPVGTYNVNLTGVGTLQSPLGYTINLSTGAGNLTVTPRPVNVNADVGSKVYGETDPALGFTSEAVTSGRGLLSGDTFAGALARAAGETVAGGPYAISQGTLANGNYSIGFTGNDFTITPRPVNVSAAAKTKVYGEADPTLTFTSETQSAGRGLKTGDTLSGALARASGETVNGGPYAISQGTVANSNYTISFTGNALTITPRPVNVNATAKTKVYGEADPTLTFTSEVQSAGRGLKTGDTLSGALTRASGETVNGGPYAISQGTVANDNYSISFTGNSLSITPRPVNVNAAAKTKVYGESDPALTFTSEAQSAGRGLKTGDTLSGSLARASGETVNGGPYAISQGTVANSNYSISFTGNTLTITPRPVNVSADAATKVYGENDPTLTFTTEAASAGRGLKSGDTLTGGLARASGETVDGGPYTIAQGTVANGNYTISFTGNALTITPRPVLLQADGQSKVYGENDPALTFTPEAASAGRGLKSGDTFTGELKRISGESVLGGPYTITQDTVANSNYAVTVVDGALIITPRPVNVSADAKTKVYGDADPRLTFAVETASAGRGLKAGDALGGDLTRVAGETVAGGPYTISQGTVNNSNYAISFTDGALTVTRAPLTVTADDKERRFGEADPVLTFTVNGSQLKSGDAASVVRGATLTAPTGISLLPDDYPITLASASADNYALTLVDGVLTVTPVPMVRSENLIVQQAPQATSGASAATAPAMTVAAVDTTGSASAIQPGILAVRDGGLSTGTATAAPTSLALAPAPRTQSAPGAFQVVVLSKPAGAPEGLMVNTAIGDARIAVGTAVKVEIPQTAFAATRADAKVTLSAQSADGAALPSWLSFNAQTGTVEGAPPAGFKGDVVVKVVARDERGNEAVQTLKISVGGQ